MSTRELSFLIGESLKRARPIPSSQPGIIGYRSILLGITPPHTQRDAFPDLEVEGQIRGPRTPWWISTSAPDPGAVVEREHHGLESHMTPRLIGRAAHVCHERSGRPLHHATPPTSRGMGWFWIRGMFACRPDPACRFISPCARTSDGRDDGRSQIPLRVIRHTAEADTRSARTASSTLIRRSQL